MPAPKCIAMGSSARLLVGCVGGQSVLGAWGGFIKQIWLSLCLQIIVFVFFLMIYVFLNCSLLFRLF